MMGYDIKLRLKDFRPLTWRDIIIPRNITFKDLHNIIQIIFDFEDCHFYNFRVPNTNFEVYDLNRCDPFGDELDSNTTKISKYFDKYSKFEYNYDFGDNWKITIEIKKKIKYDKDYVTIKRFKGKYNPIEDIGGPYDFGEMVNLLELLPKNFENITLNYSIGCEFCYDNDLEEDYGYNVRNLYEDILYNSDNSLSVDELINLMVEKIKTFSIDFIKSNNLCSDFEKFKKENNTDDVMDFISNNYLKFFREYLKIFDIESKQEILKSI